jgi:hypothetical protein
MVKPVKRILAVFADDLVGGFFGSMSDWVSRINSSLDRAKASVRVVEWFANTGNFVVTTSVNDARQVARAFASATELRCVAVTLSDLYWCLGRVRELDQPSSEAQIRWVAGAAFRVKGQRRYFEKFSSSTGEFDCLSTDIVGLQKRELIAATGRVQRARSPGWRMVSSDVAQRLGGDWIARSLQSLDGTLARALQHLDQCIF